MRSVLTEEVCLQTVFFFFTLMVSDAGYWLEVTVLNTSTRLKRHQKVCDQTLLDWLHNLGHSTAKKHNGNTIDLL